MGTAEGLESRHGITIRKMSRRSLSKDIREGFAEVYNQAWSENWGFSPYGKKDLAQLAQELQLVFDSDWFMVAEDEAGETTANAAVTARCAKGQQKPIVHPLLH